MKSKHKPIAVKVGNVSVKNSFQGADYSTGKRKLESFASEREARDVANTIAVKVAKLDGAVLTLFPQAQSIRHAPQNRLRDFH